MKYIILFIFFVVCLSDKKPPLNIQQKVKFGNFKITYLNDEGAFMKPKELYSTSETKFWNEHKNLLNENGNLFIGFGGFLIEIGNQKIIVDTGVGPDETHVKGIGFVSGGPFMKNLEKAGAKPEQITDVFLSHLHKDNVGWATTKKNGKYELTFPKANYWCNKIEWNHFIKNLKKEDNEDKEIFKDLEKRFYEPIKDVIKFAVERQQIAPGLFAISAIGHSPGLTLLKLEADRKVLWFTSDIYHSVAEFGDVTLFTDLDYSKFVQETRTIILPEFCRSHTFIANARFGKYAFGKLYDKRRVLSWEPCKVKECKLHHEGRNLVFEEDL
jgi:glyoxylase-like metal-dependent hydrolase (beta-lactamase superfamily II)